MLTQDRLKEVLSYNPSNGLFYWKERLGSGSVIGNVAGSIKSDYRCGIKYRQIMLFKKHYLQHSLVWLFHNGEFPLQIDHINGDGLDNRIENLRNVTHTENQKNKSIQRNNKSGVTGVKWDSRYKKWISYIGVNGKTIYLARSDSKEDCIKARLEAEKKYSYHENHGRKQANILPL